MQNTTEVRPEMTTIADEFGKPRKSKSIFDFFSSSPEKEKKFLKKMADILGGIEALERKIENQLDLIELARAGLNKKNLENIAEYLHYSTKQMAEVLPVTERTIQRYGKNKKFSPDVSDHILQIAQVSARGTEVFQDKEKFLTWMSASCVSFAGKTPESLLSSKFGVDMILEELGKIEHGIIS